MTRRILVRGAAGRDLHDFNVRFRNDPRGAAEASAASFDEAVASRT